MGHGQLARLSVESNLLTVLYREFSGTLENSFGAAVGAYDILFHFGGNVSKLIYDSSFRSRHLKVIKV